ncbi:MAG: MFS transporter [Dehalococcoidia bacterium]|nr:MFS transporter [Dehalococcoidia bacterium]
MTTLDRAGRPSEAYNLAQRVFGGAGSRARTPEGALAPAGEYNLAARVYGKRAGNAIPEAGDAPVAALALPMPAAVPAQPQEAVAAPRGGLFGRLTALRTFDSLRSAPFRWYFISMMGVFGAMNMQMVVRGAIVFQLTGQYTKLGEISLANALPGLILSLPGGVVADRLPKKVVQQVGNGLNAVNTVALAFLILSGSLTYNWLLVNAVVQGVIQGLMMPARQSMIPDIVYPRYVMNAVALNNVGMNISRMFMPALGGFLLAMVASTEPGVITRSTSLVFFVMAGFYIFSVVSFIGVPSKPIEIPEHERIATPSRGRLGGGHGAPAARGAKAGGLGDMLDGFKYMLRDRTVGVILIVNFLMVLCSMPYMQMLPGFVKEVLGGDAAMQGVLMSATSVGSLAAALVIASLPSKRRGAILLWGSVLLGIALIGFSASHWVWVTIPIMVVIGVGQSTRMALSNVLVQSYTDDQYRGRVMSIYMMEMSLVQISTYFVGLAADVIGIQWALGFTSALLVVLALGTYVLSPKFRNLA